jgi:hypothetical protein
VGPNGRCESRINSLANMLDSGLFDGDKIPDTSYDRLGR